MGIVDIGQDLRVQADYGRTAILMPLNKENVKNIVDEMSSFLEEVKKRYK